MAALTLPEALKRTRSLLLKGMLKEIVTHDEMANVIPIVPSPGVSLSYMREGDAPSTAFIPDTGATSENSSGTDDLVTVPMRRIVGNVDIDEMADELTGNVPGEHAGIQVARKAKATWDKIKTTMITGGYVTGFAMSDNFQSGAYVDALVAAAPGIDSLRYGPGSLKYTHAGTLLAFRAPGDLHYGTAVACAGDGSYTLYSWNKSKWITVTLDVSDATADSVREITFTSSTNEFDGIAKLVTSAQTTSSTGAAGDAFSFAQLDKLVTKVKRGNNRAFIMNGTLIEKVYAAHRALGGSQPPTIMLPNYGAPVLTYRGYPILRNDNIPSNESKGGATTLSSIYFGALDAEEGLALAAAGGSQFDVMSDPRDRTVLGFSVKDVGLLEGYDHRRYRVRWMGALTLKSTLALARQSEVVTA